VFSCSKGLVAILAASLVEQDRLDLDAPVAHYWPEFAAAGKAGATVRSLLSHRVGLPYPVRDVTKRDIQAWDPVVTGLAAQSPRWDPGTDWAYHALTYGWLVGEVLRRITGKSVGTLLQDSLAAPLDAEVWFGVPQDRLPVVAKIAGSTELTAEIVSATPNGQEIARCVTLGGVFPLSLAASGQGFNDPDIQLSEVPGGGAIATAHGLASLWTSTVVETPNTHPLDPAVLEDMTRVQSRGASFFEPDNDVTPSWGSGFMLHSSARPFLGPASFGHDGAGGQLAFADAEAKVGFAFVTNDMQNPADGRALDILDALRKIIPS
jgi:CubicO group peptidase (beta-lactamase class C family)